MATQGGLNVVALISGGKDSFFSLLHCQANGHRVVALANLYPPETTPPQGTCSSSAALSKSSATSRQQSSPAGHEDHGRGHGPASGPVDEIDSEADLNSFMYQTVGHQAIPLYATATGLPLFRQPIAGTMVQSGISYSSPQQPSSSSTTSARAAVGAPTDSQPGSLASPHGHGSGLEDETESLVPLLRAVIAAHPEVNAVCIGAILSTYQRTRIESVALRLGLVPLAYLWQFPALPVPVPASPASASSADLLGKVARGQAGSDDDAQLLRDMASAGLEARIVKVASAGLDEDFLWSNVASDEAIHRVKRALRRFGGGGRGSVLGEGGEFETIVVDGPPALFKCKIEISDSDRRVVREGGGSTWLSIRNARVGEKETNSAQIGSLPNVRVPDQFDPRFQHILDTFMTDNLALHEERSETIQLPSGTSLTPSIATLQHEFIGVGDGISVEQQTMKLVEDIQGRVDPRLILNTVIVLRQMSDFPTINKIYGGLFPEPNPPSRVTISCGNLLPEGSKIAIFTTSQPGPAPSVRRGLHVQSRSYWAPANIGPYSQAIVFPQGVPREDSASSDRNSGPQVVTIAGQIPLIAASMELPQSQESVPLQITLALQHLWRVGVELQSQWWTSAVAYFPRTPASEDMKLKATLAARAWKSAHTWSTGDSDEDDDESGPDLWDRRFNPEYMSLVGADDSEATPTLPKWEALNCYDADDDADAKAQRPVPYMFAVEVDELPRSAGVEWHAHRGLVNVSPGSVHVVNSTVAIESSNARVELQQVIVNSVDEIYIHTTAVVSDDLAQAPVELESMLETVNGVLNASTKRALKSLSELQVNLTPYLVYVDAQRTSYSERGPHNRSCQAIIPCFSVWDSRGQHLDLAMVYQAHFTKCQ